MVSNGDYREAFERVIPPPLRSIVEEIVSNIGETGFLKHLDETIQLVNNLNAMARDFGFEEPDVRATFFGKIRNAVRVYYLALDVRVAALAFALGGITNSPPKVLESHVLNLYWLLPGPTQGDVFFSTYLAGLRLNLINDAWIAFESSLDEIYKAVIPGNERERAEYRAYHSIEKLLNKCLCGENEYERIKKKLRNKHIPITDKQNAILHLDYPENRSQNEDRQFLEFFASCRNTMHNNSISFKDATFTTPIGKFQFVRGEPVDFATPAVILSMVKELAKVFEALSRAVTHEAEITDPYVMRYPKPSRGE